MVHGLVGHNTFVEGVSDAVLHALSKHCLHLTALNLEKSAGVTEHHVLDRHVNGDLHRHPYVPQLTAAYTVAPDLPRFIASLNALLKTLKTFSILNMHVRRLRTTSRIPATPVSRISTKPTSGKANVRIAPGAKNQGKNEGNRGWSIHTRDHD